MRLKIDRGSKRSALKWNEIPTRVCGQYRKSRRGILSLNGHFHRSCGVTPRVNSIAGIMGVDLVGSTRQEMRDPSKRSLGIQWKCIRRAVPHEVSIRVAGLREPNYSA